MLQAERADGAVAALPAVREGRPAPVAAADGPGRQDRRCVVDEGRPVLLARLCERPGRAERDAAPAVEAAGGPGDEREPAGLPRRRLIDPQRPVRAGAHADPARRALSRHEHGGGRRHLAQAGRGGTGAGELAQGREHARAPRGAHVRHPAALAGRPEGEQAPPGDRQAPHTHRRAAPPALLRRVEGDRGLARIGGEELVCRCDGEGGPLCLGAPGGGHGE